MPYDLKIFSGNSHKKLAQNIADSINVPLGNANVSKFSDGEIKVKIEENIRGADVFVIQPTQPPGDNWMELLIMLDALKRASASRITAVIPYFGYARQDRKEQPRVPITAKLCADLLEIAGANRVLTMDLHSPQIQAFFDIPVDHLYSSMVLFEHYRSKKIDNLVIVGPDIGAVRLARAYAKRLHCPIAILDKRRPEPNKSEIIHIIGEVKGKNILILDDMVDTAGTLIAATEALINAGVNSVEAGCAHPVLSGDAVNRIKNSGLSQITVTDTIPLPDEKLMDKLTVVSVDKVFGKAILRLHEEKSISSLFNIFV
ncbi:ribose-phosphate pyrophosphokinase [candidate division KSB1 bacterium]|nr:ribose-phosphate pyrophosphokinase [candidate division KSB1 bacterium]